MNVSSTTALTRELKPLEAPFLSTDDPGFLSLNYKTFNIFLQSFRSCIISYVLAERFSQDLLETYFWKQHPPRA